MTLSQNDSTSHQIIIMLFARFLNRHFCQAKKELGTIVNNFINDVNLGTSHISAFEKHMPDVERLEKQQKSLFFMQAFKETEVGGREVYEYLTKGGYLKDSPSVHLQMNISMIQNLSGNLQQQLKFIDDSRSIIDSINQEGSQKFGYIQIEETLGDIYCEIDSKKAISHYKKSLEHTKQFLQLVQNDQNLKDLPDLKDHYSMVSIDNIFKLLNKILVLNQNTQSQSSVEEVFQQTRQIIEKFPQMHSQSPNYYQLVCGLMSFSLLRNNPDQALKQINQIKQKALAQIELWEIQNPQNTKIISFSYLTMTYFGSVLDPGVKGIEEIKKLLDETIVKVCNIVKDEPRREDLKQFLSRMVELKMKEIS